MKCPNLTGNRFGRITVLNRSSNTKQGDSRWTCVCDCGNYLTVLGRSLRRGHTRSCGCLQRDLVRIRQPKLAELRKVDWKIRFWEHVIKSDAGCWNWSGIIIDGYGYLSVGSQARRANRLSWKLHFGSIPDHLCVLHRCDNRRCVNPEHLFLGTPADNAADMVRKGRSLTGAKNHKAKLNPKQVALIRMLYGTGKHLQRELATNFGVSQRSISCIVRGETWQTN